MTQRIPTALLTYAGDAALLDALVGSAIENPGYRTVNTAGQYNVQADDRTILIDFSALTGNGNDPVLTVMLPHAVEHIGRIVNVTVVGVNNSDFCSVTTEDGTVAGNNDFESGLGLGLGGILLAAADGLWVALGASF